MKKPTSIFHLGCCALTFLGIFLVPRLGQAETAPVTVTITQRAPIETLTPSGDVMAVSESTVGTKLSLVSCEGAKLTLQDAQGVHYIVSASATDYTPPASPATPHPAPVVAAAPAPVKPPPPAASPTSGAPAPASGSSPVTDDSSPVPTGSVVDIPMDDRDKDNVMAIWPEGGWAGRPLLIAAHGNGGSGPGEIQGWLALARERHFTIVCPTFLSSVNLSYIKQDAPYLRHCLRWIEDNLQYDKDNAYMTGFSGGGYPTWYLATQRADFFRGLFLQSGNFAGTVYDLDLARWFDKPIEVIWGSQDLPDIPVQGQNALDCLKAADCKNVIHTVVPGAGHQEHQDLVVSWMEQTAATPMSGSN